MTDKKKYVCIHEIEKKREGKKKGDTPG